MHTLATPLSQKQMETGGNDPRRSMAQDDGPGWDLAQEACFAFATLSMQDVAMPLSGRADQGEVPRPEPQRQFYVPGDWATAEPLPSSLCHFAGTETRCRRNHAEDGARRSQQGRLVLHHASQAPNISQPQVVRRHWFPCQCKSSAYEGVDSCYC